MSKLDEMTDTLLEVYNMERQILWEEAEARGFEITAEQLRAQARARLAGVPEDHPGDIEDVRQTIQPYDE